MIANRKLPHRRCGSFFRWRGIHPRGGEGFFAAAAEDIEIIDVEEPEDGLITLVDPEESAEEPEALPETGAASNAVPANAIYVNTLKALQDAVKTDGAYVVLNNNIRDMDLSLIVIYGDNVTLDLNGYTLENMNPEGRLTTNTVIKTEGYGVKIMNGTLKGYSEWASAILSYSDRLEIVDVKTTGRFGSGLVLNASEGHEAIVTVKNFNFTQDNSKTDWGAVHLNGNVHAYFDNVTLIGGELGPAPVYLVGEAKVTFISGRVRSNREVSDTGQGQLFYHLKATETDVIGNYLYASSTAVLDGTSVSRSQALDYIESQNCYRLLGWEMIITSQMNTSQPVIVRQPTDQTVPEGDWLSFAVTALGPDLNYEWQTKRHFGSSTWARFNYSGTCAGVDSPFLGISTGPNLNGSTYRCKIWNSYGTVYTDTVTITLTDVKPWVRVQPEDQTVIEGETAVLETDVWGGHLSYQWYYRVSSSGSWMECTSEDGQTDTLHVEGKAFRSGYQYRLEASNGKGSVTSEIVTLTVLSKPTITTQPGSVTISEGSYATFVVNATGGNLSYQWQYRKSSSDSWHSSSSTGNTTNALTVKATEARNGFQFRCRVRNAAGTSYSKAATLTVLSAGKPTITTQPNSKTAAVDTTVKFTVAATGAESYQWQYRKSSTGTWYNSTQTGNKTATLSVKATEARDGFQYRCKVKNAAGTTYSKYAKLTVCTKPTITTQPTSKTASAGADVTFTVKATGNALSYQWQYRKSSTGTWYNSTQSGNKTATLTVTATAARNGFQYRCKITNVAGTTNSKAVTLTVK